MLADLQQQVADPRFIVRGQQAALAEFLGAQSAEGGRIQAKHDALRGDALIDPPGERAQVRLDALSQFAIAIECKDGQRRHETQRPVTPTPLIGLRRHLVVLGKRAQELDIIPARDRPPGQRQAQRIARRVAVQLLRRTGNREQQQQGRSLRNANMTVGTTHGT